MEALQVMEVYFSPPLSEIWIRNPAYNSGQILDWITEYSLIGQTVQSEAGIVEILKENYGFIIVEKNNVIIRSYLGKG